jgi:hypothetical protein
MITNKSKFENRNLRYLLTIPFVALAIFVLACTKDDGKIGSPTTPKEETSIKDLIITGQKEVGDKFGDFYFLKEFEFSSEGTKRYSVILAKGREYLFRSTDESGSYMFKLSEGAKDIIIKSIHVDSNNRLNYLFLVEKTNAYHLKAFEAGKQEFSSKIELLIKDNY